MKIKRYKIKDIVLTVTSHKAIVKVVTAIQKRQFSFSTEDLARKFIKQLPRTVLEFELNEIYSDFIKENEND